jgi:murein tripeptide amidase MpaA
LANKKAIIFTARVHPGESSSSFVIQGLIEFLLSNEPKAISLRKNYIFKIVPMLNPDGVIRGNFRMNSVGKDLNRMWMEENEENSPSVFYCHKMIQKTLNSRNIHFFCDFHGHSSKNNFFLYSCKSRSDFFKNWA